MIRALERLHLGSWTWWSRRWPDRTIRRWLALEGNNLLLSSTGLVRRSALEEVNEFDSRVSICEDLDLAIRLREVGPILIDREVLVLSLIHI